MIIIGAGLSGLLAGQYFRSHNPRIYERQKTLPNNHKALLRFRSSVVSDLTGIRFKKVRVQKMINYKGSHLTESNLFLNNLYSFKCTRTYRDRSVMSLAPAERYIAPEDFITRVAMGLKINYGVEAGEYIESLKSDGTIIISTIPVMELAKILGYELNRNLVSRPIWTITGYLFCDADIYQTVYYPNPDLPLYRLSITGNKVIAEFITDPDLTAFGYTELCHFLKEDFGIDNGFTHIEDHYQLNGKLVAAEDNSVKDFMGWATANHNIYSLGRWGTHRQLLMDDVVQDLKVIDNMIATNKYGR
jgi:hypothetical protein